ncbi:hypothetical protein PAAG_05665 [Paracoccidioides lutzii Pb01]|uniref:Alpha/beta hydrolase fold-3 domain-containing protein n=1 Tax=Paracoccidioides lutzii (strain ATCC MYA-826 / Pb01) TaxID=502779 RepID=C1H4H2_PARBA|nr:hypothetical protein PAAG_05665 [Paracoccidioides lutzii Pb01]EEH34616.1 hypothetical protein PAAG_05665 [Paracoccidioides lutzii Pb01]
MNILCITGPRKQTQNDRQQASRLWLRIKATTLRILMKIGMILHGYIPFPSPPIPCFTRTIKPSSSPISYVCSPHVRSLPSFSKLKDMITLHFYTPANYQTNSADGKRWPVVVNFHGGGFTIGSATDDCRWARIAVSRAKAVFVSVDYRLAPENPFPAAVDDGVDALLYLEANSEALSLDMSRVSLTGFSAGGNLAVTVPLRLYRRTIELHHHHHQQHQQHQDQQQEQFSGVYTPASGYSYEDLGQIDSNQFLLSHLNHSTHSLPQPETHHPPAQAPTPSINFQSIFAWYPILDFVTTRETRRNRSKNPDKRLPGFLTNLFDESYVPRLEDRVSPFASPLRATDTMLAEALPADVFLYVCEWDMLLEEGQEFAKKLEGLGKKVRSMMVAGQGHAWDKSVNPLRDQEAVDLLYQEACEEMRGIFERGR